MKTEVKSLLDESISLLKEGAEYEVISRKLDSLVQGIEARQPDSQKEVLKFAKHNELKRLIVSAAAMAKELYKKD